MENEPQVWQEERYAIPMYSSLVRKGESWYIEVILGYLIPISSEEGMRLHVHLRDYFAREWQRDLQERNYQAD